MQQNKTKDYTKRILYSRFRILNNHGFYGLMLMHMKFGLDPGCGTAYTDSSRICFDPAFLDEISDSELDFIMMHEIMHVVLKHCKRGEKYNPELFNIACDIVVNSNILYSNAMNLNSITLKKYGTSMHEINGEEGYGFTAEEVYQKLLKKAKKIPNRSFDDHSHWERSQKKGNDSVMNGSSNQGTISEEEWNEIILSAVMAEERRAENGGRNAGSLPLGIKRLVRELTDSTVNWREILHEFVEEDMSDYSFTPPDRRYDDFFLPDFNAPQESVAQLLFMIDTSGSVDDVGIRQAYSEIAGAIEQFDGHLLGYVGFFDAAVYEPKPFMDLAELQKIVPQGGGGTSYEAVFRYVGNLEEKPRLLIILTDGFCDFPPQKMLGGIPLLWLISNDEVTPPYGKIARMLMKKE